MAKYEIEFTEAQDADLKLAIAARRMGPMWAQVEEPATDQDVLDFFRGEAQSIVQQLFHRQQEVERQATIQTKLQTDGWVEAPVKEEPVPVAVEPAPAK